MVTSDDSNPTHIKIGTLPYLKRPVTFGVCSFENDKNAKNYVIFTGNCFHLRDFTDKKFSKPPFLYSASFGK